MKKIYSLLAASFAFALCANAADLTPEPIAIANPSFEEGGDNHLDGWNINPTEGLWSARQHTNSAYAGDWYVRIALNSELEPGTIIDQWLDPGKGPGVYVLTAACNVSRNGWRGDVNTVGGGTAYVDEENPGEPGTIFGALWIADDDDDPTDPESRGFVKIGECLGNWRVITVVYKSEIDGASINIGFGLPSCSNGNPKGDIQCDDFKLDYYNTMDEEAVKALLFGDSGIDEIYATDQNVGDNKYYNLQGIAVEEPAPGLYVRNGKKVLVK